MRLEQRTMFFTPTASEKANWKDLDAALKK